MFDHHLLLTTCSALEPVLMISQTCECSLVKASREGRQSDMEDKALDRKGLCSSTNDPWLLLPPYKVPSMDVTSFWGTLEMILWLKYDRKETQSLYNSFRLMTIPGITLFYLPTDPQFLKDEERFGRFVTNKWAKGLNEWNLPLKPVQVSVVSHFSLFLAVYPSPTDCFLMGKKSVKWQFSLRKTLVSFTLLESLK